MTSRVADYVLERAGLRMMRAASKSESQVAPGAAVKESARPTPAPSEDAGGRATTQAGADNSGIGLSDLLTVDNGLEAPVPALPGSRPFDDKVLLHICIPSAPEDRAIRKLLRTSWMQHPLVKRGQVKVQFFIASRPSDEMQRKLDTELLANQDMVYLPGLAKRPSALEILRWAGLYVKSRFVMKLDPDTFPSLDKIVSLIKAEAARFSIYGHIRECATEALETGRDKGPAGADVGRRIVQIFRQFAQGGGYVLTRELAVELGVTRYQEHKASPPMKEGEGIGTWIALDKTMNQSLKETTFKHFPSTVGDCTPGDILSLNVKLASIRCMWEKSRRDPGNHCCEPATPPATPAQPGSPGQASFLQRVIPKPAGRGGGDRLFTIKGATNRSSSGFLVSRTANADILSAVDFLGPIPTGPQRPDVILTCLPR